MLLYVTKHALTEGIKIVDCRPSGPEKGCVRDVLTGASYTIGLDAFETPLGAIVNAEQQQARRIATLRKHIQQLEALEFVVDHDEEWDSSGR